MRQVDHLCNYIFPTQPVDWTIKLNREDVQKIMVDTVSPLKGKNKDNYNMFYEHIYGKYVTYNVHDRKAVPNVGYTTRCNKTPWKFITACFLSINASTRYCISRVAYLFVLLFHAWIVNDQCVNLPLENILIIQIPRPTPRTAKSSCWLDFILNGTLFERLVCSRYFVINDKHNSYFNACPINKPIRSIMGLLKVALSSPPRSTSLPMCRQ